MTDAARAVRWVRDNLDAGSDKSRPLFIGGHSAGTHIAALLAADRQHLNKEDLSPETLCGVIGLAGHRAFQDPAVYLRAV